MIYKLNTSCLPILDVGMYETVISPTFLYECSEENEPENFDFDKYKDFVFRHAKGYVEGEYNFDGVKVSIKCTGITSPRYYNYSTNTMDIEVKVKKPDLLDYAKRHSGDFDRFLRRYNLSGPGYCSFTAHSFEEWQIKFLNNSDIDAASLLYFMFDQHEKMPEQRDFEWDISEDFLNQNFEA